MSKSSGERKQEREKEKTTMVIHWRPYADNFFYRNCLCKYRIVDIFVRQREES